jgi:hypothetical protein
MSTLSAEQQKTVKYDRDAVFRCALRYGLLGVLISVPLAAIGFLHLGIPGPERLRLMAEIDPGMNAPHIASNMLSHAMHLLGLWTFAVPVVVSILLLRSAGLARVSDLRAPIWFSRAYRLMYFGGIVSWLPLVLPVSIIFSIRTSGGTAKDLPFVLAVSSLPFLYYVVLWRIRRVYGRLPDVAEAVDD